jgi:hypothetical protein
MERGLRVFEIRVLRRKLGIKREVTTGGRRILFSEEYHIRIRAIKSRSMRWVGHIAYMRKM